MQYTSSIAMPVSIRDVCTYDLNGVSTWKDCKEKEKSKLAWVQMRQSFQFFQTITYKEWASEYLDMTQLQR